MIERFDPDLIQWYRSTFIEGEEALLNKHIGHFITYFNIAETMITYALALVLKFGDLERLEYLVKGLDPREKCSRLRGAAKKYLPLGPCFSSELAIFEKDCIKTRNMLAHSWPHYQQDSGLILYSTIGKFQHNSPVPISMPPAKDVGIHIDDLVSMCMWLNLFNGDIGSAMEHADETGVLEIGDERLNQRPEVRLRSQKKDRPASARKQPQAPPQSEGE